jgi:hypothetical protein
MRPRIKKPVVISDIVTEIDERTNKRNECYNTIIQGMASEFMHQGFDWVTARKFAMAKLRMRTSLSAMAMMLVITMQSCAPSNGLSKNHCNGIKNHPNYNHKTFKR